MEQTEFLVSPVYIGQAQEEDKTYKKRSQRARGLSPMHACVHALLLSLFFLSPSFSSLLGQHAFTPPEEPGRLQSMGLLRVKHD